MDRLATTLMDIPLKNPLMMASGTFGSGEEFTPYLQLNHLGAVIMKGTTLAETKGNPPGRLAETPSGLLNCIGLQNPGVDALIRDTVPKLSAYDVPFFANISGNTVEEYGKLAEKLDIDGIAAIEVNISCPNVKAGGLAFGTRPDDAYAVTKIVKEHTSKNVMVKLSPNVTDIKEMALAVETGGADAVSLVNTLLGMDIDIDKKKPVLSNTFGGLSGPAIRPIGLRMVYEVYQVVSIPIVGLGGIMEAKDVIAYILAGAQAVQIGTANLIQPNISIQILKELQEYLQEQNIKHISELVGKAHPDKERRHD